MVLLSNHTWYVVLFNFLCWSTAVLNAQNLVPNSSLEEYWYCPETWGTGGPLPATPWDSGSQGTTDYFNVCNNEGSGTAGVPSNFAGFQYAKSGVAYGGLYARLNGSTDYREYLMCPLDAPLIANQEYQVSFWYSLGDNFCPSTNIGALLTAGLPPLTPPWIILADPQVGISVQYLDDSENWVLLSDCFIAEGGENYITIGNFYSNAETPIDPTCNASPAHSYYYIDDVTVVPVNGPLDDLELGEPIVSCNMVTLTANVNDVAYHWSNGATTQSTTVTTSGTYVLTITGGCTHDVDSVEVLILGTNDPVNIPEEEIILCDGNPYVISLEPAYGDYVWSTGDTGPEITITSPGLYIVSLDDGCDISSDAVQVTTMNSPEPVSLGPDQSLCENDEMEISFDPSLGTFLWQDGSNAPNFTIDQAGTYAVTISNECGSVTDNIVITELPEPEADLSMVTDICHGDTIWLHLDPSLGEYEWQDGSTSPDYFIAEGGLYQVTVTNDCGQASDQAFVSLIEPPDFSLGADQMVCPELLPFQLDVTWVPFALNYLWQDGSTDPVMDILDAGIYSVTISNDCFTGVDTVQIEVGASTPEVELPDDFALCAGETFILENTGAQGDYLWQDGSIEEFYVVEESGTYSLTITNACGQGSDAVIVTYFPPLEVPDLGPDFSLCPGEQVELVIQTDEFIEWQDQSSDNSFVVTQPGTYHVTIFNACSFASDTVHVSSESMPPTLDLPETLFLCQQDSVWVESNVTNVQYQWNTGVQEPNLQVTTPGTYSLTVSNACGTSSDTVEVMDGGSAPMISVGPDTGLCPGDSLSLSPTFDHVINWQWENGTSDTTRIIYTPGVYSVEGSNLCGTTRDSLEIQTLPGTPTLYLGPDTSICPQDSVMLIIGVPDVDILWFNGTEDDTLWTHEPGTMFATISDVCGQSSDTLRILGLPDIPALDLGPDQSLCTGETITLSPGIPDVQYLWHDGTAETSFNAQFPGSISLTISNACGMSADTINVTENNDPPQIDLGPDISGCVGEMVTVYSQIAGVEYMWQDGSTLPSFTTHESATLILEVSNNCGSDTDTIEVLLDQASPDIYLGPDSTLCDDQTLLLNVSVETGTELMWQDGSTLAAYLITSPGSYIVAATNMCGSDQDTIEVTFQNAPPDFSLGPDLTLCDLDMWALYAPDVTDVDGVWQDGSVEDHFFAESDGVYSLLLTNACGTSFDEIVLDFETSPDAFDLGPDTTICPGQSIVLSLPMTTHHITWQDGSHDDVFVADSTQIYSATISNACGSSYDDIFIEVKGDIPTVDLEGLLTICLEDTLMLNAAQPFEALYQWNTGAEEHFVLIHEEGEYSITVTTPCGIAHDAIIVIEQDCTDPVMYFVPNVFSPNGDQINDVFTIYFNDGVDILSMEGEIYDRWGTLLYGSRENPFVWDGTFQHTPLNPAVYVYRIVVTYMQNGQPVTVNLHGDVTVVR